MFLNFYGLREQPFGVTPDGRYLYLSATHREALASLFYGLETGRGFLALVAKPGMGKTTLLFRILEKFQYTARTAFLFNTQCNSREFVQYLVSELGFECRARNFVQLVEEFNRNLVREARQGRRCIVVIDEAQNLDPAVLETARLLSNFETSRAKLLQIVLAGQPELANKLSSPGQRQLRQRISMFNRLEPFTAEETAKYIYHRLQTAGYKGPSFFTPDALGLIAEHSGGIPRAINTLCFAAMSLGCAMKSKTVTAAMVEEAVADLDIKNLGASEELDTEYHEVVRKGGDYGSAHFVSPMTFGKLLRKIEPAAADLQEPVPIDSRREAEPIHIAAPESPVPDPVVQHDVYRDSTDSDEAARLAELADEDEVVNIPQPAQPPLVAPTGLRAESRRAPARASRVEKPYHANLYLGIGVVALFAASLYYLSSSRSVAAGSMVAPRSTTVSRYSNEVSPSRPVAATPKNTARVTYSGITVARTDAPENQPFPADGVSVPQDASQVADQENRTDSEIEETP